MSESFAHRYNVDETIDSICPRCFLTIGTSTAEVDLRRIESAHVCDLDRRAYFEDSVTTIRNAIASAPHTGAPSPEEHSGSMTIDNEKQKHDQDFHCEQAYR